MFPAANKCPLYPTKTYKNYLYNREDIMTKIIATHIHNINETFIGIFIDISLGYIIYFHDGHD